MIDAVGAVYLQSDLALLTKFDLSTEDVVVRRPSPNPDFHWQALVELSICNVQRRLTAAPDAHGAIALLKAVGSDLQDQTRTALISVMLAESLTLTNEHIPFQQQAEAHLTRVASDRSMDGPVSRFFTRRVSKLLSPCASRAGLEPNLVTLCAGASALGAMLLFSLGTYAGLLLGALMWFVSDILDEVDGEVARLQLKQSEFGSWLDLTIDRMVDGLVLVALAWPILEASSSAALILGLGLSLVIVSTSSYTGLLYDSWMRREHGLERYFRIGRDSRNMVIVLGAILSLRLETIGIVTVLSAVEIVRRLWVCRRSELRRI